MRSVEFVRLCLIANVSILGIFASCSRRERVPDRLDLEMDGKSYYVHCSGNMQFQYIKSAVIDEDPFLCSYDA